MFSNIKLVGIALLVGVVLYLSYNLRQANKTIDILRANNSKQEVIIATVNNTVEQLIADNKRKDELHQIGLLNNRDEKDKLDERLAELQEQNKLLLDDIMQRPVEVGDAINARRYQRMCRLYYGKDCPSTHGGKDDALQPSDSSSSEADTPADNSSD